MTGNITTARQDFNRIEILSYQGNHIFTQNLFSISIHSAYSQDNTIIAHNNYS
jgi:hypothetical protein